MPDINPDIVEKPVVFEPTATKAVLGTGIGAILLVVSGTTTLLGFLKARALLDALRWLQGTEGVSYLAACTLVATLVWRFWTTVRKHAKALIAARAADDSAAIVKGE